MISSSAKPSDPAAVFPDWAARLEADASLSPGLRASYRVTLTRFLAFCARRGTEATVALAREHIELVRLEHAPSSGRLEEGSRKRLRLTRF